MSGASANAFPAAGRVLVKAPGGRYVPLEEARSIPIGSLVDARRGKVRIVSDAGGGRTRSAVFHGGIFRLLQGKRPGAYTEVRLAGPLFGCGKGAQGAASTSARKGKRGRPRGRLVWGNGKGKHRTTGRNSSASVRGTVWLVWDRCDRSTLTRVKQGRVAVRDFRARRTVLLRKGKSYVAKPRGRKRGR